VACSPRNKILGMAKARRTGARFRGRHYYLSAKRQKSSIKT
jgi:hypothetical protein